MSGEKILSGGRGRRPAPSGGPDAGGDGAIKLQKFIADCGIMSRRAAEKKILDGSITVNGEPVEIGRRVDPSSDSVAYLGRPVTYPTVQSFAYIMLNKPRGYVTTMSDEFGRKCIAELVSDVGCRVFPCGRLDADSEGLLILTNDGEFANRVTHPSHHIPKRYTVRVRGEVSEKQLGILNCPIEIDGYMTSAADVTVISAEERQTILSVTLYEGRNRQIRRMCEKAGLLIKRLRRVAVGDVELGDLPPGKWRRLTREEIDCLRNY
ncbi:MAG: rRNA pseudouridine synthase [Clostridia bacterium]|nr:rRNA pseudouridine synthase [Clostridia bacterium]